MGKSTSFDSRAIHPESRQARNLTLVGRCWDKGTRRIYAQLSEPATPNLGPGRSAVVAPQPQPGMAFAISLPRYITRTSEYINTKEMRAVGQALLHWGNKWREMKVVMHTDNKAVVYGMENRTIRGGSMKVLRRCLLLAAEFDLKIEAK